MAAPLPRRRQALVEAATLLDSLEEWQESCRDGGPEPGWGTRTPQSALSVRLQQGKVRTQWCWLVGGLCDSGVPGSLDAGKVGVRLCNFDPPCRSPVVSVSGERPTGFLSSFWRWVPFTRIWAHLKLLHLGWVLAATSVSSLSPVNEPFKRGMSVAYTPSVWA